MKQQEFIYSKGSNGACGWAEGWGDMLDLDAWEGYEFWSRQLEAEMDLYEPARPIESEREERTSDVFPF